jgi:hypothetical protein
MASLESIPWRLRASTESRTPERNCFKCGASSGIGFMYDCCEVRKGPKRCFLAPGKKIELLLAHAVLLLVVDSRHLSGASPRKHRHESCPEHGPCAFRGQPSRCSTSPSSLLFCGSSLCAA